MRERTSNIAAQALVLLIAELPREEDTEAALSFLRQPDLVELPHPSGPMSFYPVKDCLRTFRIRHETVTRAGIEAYGFPRLIGALAALPSAQTITCAALQTSAWIGLFWTDHAAQLVGFVLVKKSGREYDQP